MQVKTSDGVTIGNVLKVHQSICAIQKTKVLKAFEPLKEYVAYSGHKVKITSRVSWKNSIPLLLQGLELYQWQGKVYSRNKDVFVKEFAECLACILKGFEVLLRENKAKKIKRISITASELRNGLKWLLPVMKAVGCCTRPREIQIGNIIKELEDQGVY
jgi:hypothetical protein